MTEVKAVSEAQGILEGYLNVKNVEDLGGDISRDGCFRKTLADSYSRKAAQNLQGLWPFLYNHDYSTVPPGLVTEAQEDRKGLWIRCQCFMDTEMGRNLYSAYAQGGLTAFSMGYKAHSVSWEQINGKSIRNLLEVQICEASSVVFPMNTDSTITSVKGGSSMLTRMRSKDFDSRYADQQMDDWQFADWYDLATALKQSIMDLFVPGGSPLQDFETDVAPQLLAALRAYISEGVSLGYTGDSSNGMDMDMMSMAGAGRESKAGYLNASDHAAIKESSTMIMKHAKIIANASANVERANARARAGSLAGWPVYGSMSSRSIFEEKADEATLEAQLRMINNSLEVDNMLKESRELLMETMPNATDGVDRALRNLLASLA